MYVICIHRYYFTEIGSGGTYCFAAHKDLFLEILSDTQENGKVAPFNDTLKILSKIIRISFNQNIIMKKLLCPSTYFELNCFLLNSLKLLESPMTFLINEELQSLPRKRGDLHERCWAEQQNNEECKFLEPNRPWFKPQAEDLAERMWNIFSIF